MRIRSMFTLIALAAAMFMAATGVSHAYNPCADGDPPPGANCQQ